jgi:hydroxyacylglutathione hydrolase
MFFERIVADGIAHLSYIIGSGGKAAVIDPRRDCEVYLDLAAGHDLAITHIFETHRNEDYVSGSPELAARCGAKIYHGAQIAFAFGKPVREGDSFVLGSLELTVLETPGHTEESITLVLRDRETGSQPYMIFCGDTLFAGDIARTDFFGKDRKEEMAKKIFDSITGKILPLGDGAIVCPAHGAGSVCGEEIADHPFTTIGYERQTNLLLALGRETFAARRVQDSPYLPPYFRQMERLNKDGAPFLHHLPYLQPLSPEDLNHLRTQGCQILDIRAPTSFAAGHIPGSLSIWRDGIPSFIGWFLDYERPIVLIDDFNVGLETPLRHLIRLGYDRIGGYLSGGFPLWSRMAQETHTFATCTVQELNERLAKESLFLLDVRDIRNRDRVGHIRGAHHIYIGELPHHLDEIPRNGPVVVYCDAGFKGSLAASVLAIHQYRDITNVLGGMTAWKQAGFGIEK